MTETLQRTPKAYVQVYRWGRRAESVNGWYHPSGTQALSLDFIFLKKIIPCVSLSPRRCYNPWKSYYKDFQGPLSRRESPECAAGSGPLRYYPEEMASPVHSPASYHFRHLITSASVRILLPAVTEIPTQAVLNGILKESAGPRWSHCTKPQSSRLRLHCDLTVVSGI